MYAVIEDVTGSVGRDLQALYSTSANRLELGQNDRKNELGEIRNG